MNSILPPENRSIERQFLEIEERKKTKSLDALLASCTSTFDSVWNNPHRTPAQMIAAQGTKAKANFEDHARTVIYLLGMGVAVPAKYQAAPLPYTAHDDGTITLD
jgi:hypothetical protein